MREEISISDQRKLVIQKTKFRDKDTLDIRTWLSTESYQGFTKKGINIPIEKGEELAQKILKVIRGESTSSSE